jgi:hypothetical protein
MSESHHLKEFLMKSRKEGTFPTRARRDGFKWARISLILAVFAVSVSAAILGGLLPAGMFSGSAQAQVQPDKGKRAGQPGSNQDNTDWISDSAREQIAGLIDEKRNRSAARKKMDSRLIYSIKMARGEELAPGLATLEISIPLNEEGRPIIDITARVSKKLIAKLEAAGVKIIASYPAYNSIRAEADLEILDTIAGFPEVIYIQPKQEAMTSQAISLQDDPSNLDPDHLRMTRPGFKERQNTVREKLRGVIGGDGFDELYTIGVSGVRKAEGDTTMRAAFSRDNYGFDGTGVKIGVLSNGVRNLAAVQASGDLGPVTVLPGQSGTAAGQCATTISCDEGTAMLEIVHDLAPGAQLFYATGLPTPAAFAQNIRDLRTAGCDIIIDDLFYFAESPFQDGQAPAVVSPNNGGAIAQAVADVTANGALYFSSAGNSGNKNDNTSGVWEGDFVDGGAVAAPIVGAGRLHQFPVDGATPAQNFNVVTVVGSGQYNLNWSDPLGGSGNDYDLYALNSTGTALVSASTSTQDGNDDPLESIAPSAAGTRLVIVKLSGAARFLRITTNRGRLTVNTPGQTTGHSTIAAAFGVAATPAVGPFPSQHSAANVLETFSSDGPRKLFFQADGTPFTPGDVSSTGGILRQKPDITAADGVSVTGAGGFGIQFFGTSAAAPHAGAVAALLKSGNPSLTPAQIRTALQSTAIDIETAGVDRDSGNGIVMADNAFGTFFAPPAAANLSLGTPSVADVGGNNNGYIEPGEAATVSIPLLNTGVISATAVSATISSSTPGVSFNVPSATRTYPDIASAGNSTSAAPFSFVYLGTAVYAADIDFVLTATYNGGITRSFPFKVPTGQLAFISTTLDTTAPASGANYTAATGTQTGRTNFTFPISACGSTKTNPGPTSTLARRYDSFTFTNTSGSTICATVLLTHSANVLIHANAYIGAFTPATPAVGWAGDGGGSATSGAGTAQLFSVNVGAGQTLVVVVSESNQNGGLNTPYNLRITGLPAAAVPANQAPVNAVPASTVNVPANTIYPLTGGNQISVSDPDAAGNLLRVTITTTNGNFTLSGTSGLTFSAGDGAQDSVMTFTGTLTDINAALTNASYRSNLNYTGPASITIDTDDLGNVGAGNNQTDSDVISLNVLSPTAAPVSVSGRVATSSGNGVVNAAVTITGQDGIPRTTRTSPFGYYRFDNITSGQIYLMSVSAKRYRFSPRFITVGDDITDVDFTPNE